MIDLSAWLQNLILQNEIKLSDHIQWREEEPMSRHTTFRIGGSAALYVVCSSTEALCQLVTACRKDQIRYLILGNGSNLLIADEGFFGIVISMGELNGVEIGDTTITCQAGVSLTAVSRMARDNSLTGMEFANGIPGSIGGAVFMNAGAYNSEMSDIVVSSTYLDASDGTIHTLTGKQHRFAYRDSIYRSHPEWVILSCTLQLHKGDKEAICAKMENFMEQRIEKQPLDFPNAGSVFKRYPGMYTSQLIDEAGLKGKRIGGAQVSPKHAGFIINTGKATCQDVLSLIDLIRKTIAEKYGIEIECELIHIQ